MAAIAFSKDAEKSWVVAGWAFRQLLDDVIAQNPGDSEMAEKFAQSKTHSGLMVYLLGPEFAARVTSAIKHIVTGILSGTIRSGIYDQPYGDTRTVEQYRAALQELLKAIPPLNEDFP
jgi:hypothetical protein